MACAGGNAELPQYTGIRDGSSFLLAMVGMADYRKTHVLCDRTIYYAGNGAPSQYFLLRKPVDLVGIPGGHTDFSRKMDSGKTLQD